MAAALPEGRSSLLACRGFEQAIEFSNYFRRRYQR